MVGTVRKRLEPDRMKDPGVGSSSTAILNARAYEVVTAALHLVDKGRAPRVADEADGVVDGEPVQRGLVETVEAAATGGVDLAQQGGLARLTGPIDHDYPQVTEELLDHRSEMPVNERHLGHHSSRL
jgi:hypothetical protein